MDFGEKENIYDTIENMFFDYFFPFAFKELWLPLSFCTNQLILDKFLDERI